MIFYQLLKFVNWIYSDYLFNLRERLSDSTILITFILLFILKIYIEWNESIRIAVKISIFYEISK